MMLSKKFAAVAAVSLAVVLTGASATAAFANHNRSNESSFSVTGNTATWNVVTGWMDDDVDYMISDTVGDTVEVQQLTAVGDAPDSGTSTGVYLSLTSYTTDTSSSLYDISYEEFSGDLSTLGDGVYVLYSETCCKAITQNSSSDEFSVWTTFTKTGSTYDVAPVTTAVAPVTAVNMSGNTVIDFTATDSSAISYSLITDQNLPGTGFSAVPCSNFTGSVFTVGPSYCTGGDVFPTSLQSGPYWGVKVRAIDAAGNETATSAMLHILTAPQPYIDYIAEYGSNDGTLGFAVYDDNGETVDSWTVSCTNTVLASDVVSGTGTPVADGIFPVSGFTLGQSYDCGVSATNSAGSGSSTAGTFGPVEAHHVYLTSALAVGQVLSGKSVTISAVDVYDADGWTLTQDALLLASGPAPLGVVNEPVFIPASACVAGSHVLTATTTGDNYGEAMTRSLYYTLDADCRITAFSATGTIGGLAATGVDVSPLVPAGALFGILGGLALLVLRRRQAI